MLKRSLAAALAAGSIFTISAVNADERPAPPERPQMRRGGMAGMPGGRGGMQDMAIARMVSKELKAYQANPSAENYQALEKATREAVKKFTEKRKEMLQKQLAELEKNQDKSADAFLAKVKSGEFKMPPKRQRNSNPGKRGPRPDKKGNPPAAN